MGIWSVQRYGVVHLFKLVFHKADQPWIIALVVIEADADVTVIQFCWKRMAVNEQRAGRKQALQAFKMPWAHVKQMLRFCSWQDATAITAEIAIQYALALSFERVIVKSLHVAHKTRQRKNDTCHLFVGGCKEEVSVPVGPLVHAVVDEMWIAWPLAISVKNAGDTWMRNVQYDIFHLNWVRFWVYTCDSDTDASDESASHAER